MSRGGKREGSGRKLILSAPLQNKTIRMTDEEYDLVREMLKRRRKAIKKLKVRSE